MVSGGTPMQTGGTSPDVTIQHFLHSRLNTEFNNFRASPFLHLHPISIYFVLFHLILLIYFLLINIFFYIYIYFLISMFCIVYLKSHFPSCCALSLHPTRAISYISFVLLFTHSDLLMGSQQHPS